MNGKQESELYESALDLNEIQEMIDSTEHFYPNTNILSSKDGLDNEYYDEEEYDDGDFDLSGRVLNQRNIFGMSATEVFDGGKSSRKRHRKLGRPSLLAISPEINNMISQANYLIVQGELNQAKDVLENIIKLNPRIHYVYDNLAKICDDLGKNILSLKYAAAAAAHMPKNSQGIKHNGPRWLNVAKKAMKLGLYKQALSAASSASRLRIDLDTMKQGFLYKAMAFLMLDNIPSANIAMKSLILKFPTYLSALVDFGSKCEEVQRYDLAINYYLRYVIRCMTTKYISPDIQNSFIYFPTASQISLFAANEKQLTELDLNEIDLEQYFFCIERISDLCFDMSDKDTQIVDSFQFLSSKAYSTHDMFNQFSLSIIDACFNYLDQLRKSTYRNSDHEALQVPMMIGFLYSICHYRRGDEEDLINADRIINPLLTSLSRNRKLIIDKSSSQTSNTEEYIENFSLITQQIRVLEEYLRQGKTTRSTRISIDILTEIKYLVSTMSVDGDMSGINVLLSCLIRLGSIFDVASNLSEDNTVSQNLFDYSCEAFATAIEVDKDGNSLLLSVRFADFISLNEAKLSKSKYSDQYSNLLNTAYKRLDDFYSSRIFAFTTRKSLNSSESAADRDDEQINDTEDVVGGDELDPMFSNLGEEFPSTDAVPTNERENALLTRISKTVAEYDMTDTIYTTNITNEFSTGLIQKLSYRDQELQAKGLIALTKLQLLLGDHLTAAAIRIIFIISWLKFADPVCLRRQANQVLNALAANVVENRQNPSLSESSNRDGNQDFAKISSESKFFNPKPGVLPSDIVRIRSKLTKDPSCEYVPILSISTVEGLLNDDLILYDIYDLRTRLDESENLRGVSLYSMALLTIVDTTRFLDPTNLLSLAKSASEVLNTSSIPNCYAKLKDVYIPCIANMIEPVVIQPEESKPPPSAHSKVSKAISQAREKVVDANLSDDNELLNEQEKVLKPPRQAISVFRSDQGSLVNVAGTISPEAKAAATALTASPQSISAVNLLVKAIFSHYNNAFDRVHAEHLLPVHRLQSHFSSNPAILLLRGSELALKRRFMEALEKYFDAFKLNDSQPLISLAISSLLIFLSFHRMVKQRQECANRALFFLHHYRIHRLKHADKIHDYYASQPSTGTAATKNERLPVEDYAIIQEVHYNIARGVSEIGINNIAADNYFLALEQQDSFDRAHETSCSEGGPPLPLTRQAAFNLILILKKSNSLGLAQTIMQKYLKM